MSAAPDDHDGERAVPEKQPGRLARVSAGWKAVSGAVATIATAVGVLTTLGLVGGGGGGPGPSDAMAAAASKTATAGSSTLQVSITRTPRGAAAADTIVGRGEIDYRGGRGRMEWDLSNSPGLEDLGEVEVLFNGPVLYVPAAVLGLPKDKPWVRVAFADLDRIDSTSQYAVLSDLKIDDPTQVVKSLDENSSGAKKVGEEQAFGVKTTHYRAQRDPDGKGPATPTTVDLLVDEAGYMRRVETLSHGASGTVKTVTLLDEFGVAVDARPPPSRRAVDFGRLLRGT
ncbi:MAG TPA: hypothetical protein VF545_02480 [Thermoleophilaceae bacterium]